MSNFHTQTVVAVLGIGTPCGVLSDNGLVPCKGLSLVLV